MLDAASRVRDQVRVAEIMSVSSDPYRHALVVDKGSNDGVFDGQAMIDANGVVGQIIETGVLSSQGLLISDPDHALQVAVNRNGLRTIARGTGTFGRLDLPALPNNADIQVGDLLITTGLGGVFPPGYPVAVVDSVVRLPQEPYAAVSATPTAALDQVREIMLIWSARQAEPDEPETPEQAPEQPPDDNAAQTGAADEATTGGDATPEDESTDE
jgi:rod shape-determining protein MreC